MKYAVAAVIVVALLAAISVPCMLTAMQRSDQKRTMGDMRTIAEAWEARAGDRRTYVVGHSGSISCQDLRRALEPKYLAHLPCEDGWGNLFQFSGTDQEYEIRALGSDHKADAKLIEGPTTGFDQDIVYKDGAFVSYPEGV